MPLKSREDSIAKYTAVIKDEDGAVIPGASLTGVFLTLYADDSAKTIINSRDGVTAYKASGEITVDGSGNLAFTFLAADNKIVDDTKEWETHTALFRFTWTGTKQGYHEVEILVENLEKVTS